MRLLCSCVWASVRQRERNVERNHASAIFTIIILRAIRFNIRTHSKMKWAMVHVQTHGIINESQRLNETHQNACSISFYWPCWYGFGFMAFEMVHAVKCGRKLTGATRPIVCSRHSFEVVSLFYQFCTAHFSRCNLNWSENKSEKIWLAN